jgi:hypothetical protein
MSGDALRPIMLPDPKDLLIARLQARVAELADRTGG